MRSIKIAKAISSACMLFTGCVLVHLSASAEEGTVEAFSSWQARGHVFPTGPNESTFTGVLSGIVYVRGKDNSFDTGLITCPASVTVNTENLAQSGNGKCVIVTPTSERIYAKFNCSGTYGTGCNGDFVLNGGTGDKTNISGGGPIQFRSAHSKLTVRPGNLLEQSAFGLAIWPSLNYKIPE